VVRKLIADPNPSSTILKTSCSLSFDHLSFKLLPPIKTNSASSTALPLEK
jgi:hypothetical protein